VAGPIAPLISRTAATPAADAAAAMLTPGEPAAGARTAVGVSAATNVADIAAQVTAIAHSRPTRRDFTMRTLLPAQTGWQPELSAVFDPWTLATLRWATLRFPPIAPRFPPIASQFPPGPVQRNALATALVPPMPAAPAERAAGLCAACGTDVRRRAGLPESRRCRRVGRRAPADACRSRSGPPAPCVATPRAAGASCWDRDSAEPPCAGAAPSGPSG